jgi:hypothetical protein
MKILLMIVLVGLAAAGCAPAPQAAGNRNDASANGTASGNPALSAADATATAVGAANGSNPASQPLAVTVRPPVIQLGPGGTPGFPGSTPLPLSPEGWLTFTSPALGAAVDYPPDWTAAEGTDGAAFTSPDGARILLQVAEANPPAQDCTALVNLSGLTANVCVDSTAGRYSATFAMKPAEGSAQAVTLSTTDQAALDVYKSMINSLRPAQ